LLFVSLPFLFIYFSNLASSRQTVAETNFPNIEDQNGIMVDVQDVFGKKFSFKYRFWVNNSSRMYLVENTQELLQYYKLALGDVLVFARLANAEIVVCGRKGTKEDGKKKKTVKRQFTAKAKAGSKRSRSSATAASGGGSGTARTSPTAAGEDVDVEESGAVSMGDRAKSRELTEGASAGEGPSGSKAAAVKSKKSRQQKPPTKKEREGVNSMYEYWNALSLPARCDGVFRAVPPVAEVVPNKVTAQQGHWTAVVNLGGELYQAFFDSRDSAVAAFNAAVQD
jgi:hypothetical protein